MKILHFSDIHTGGIFHSFKALFDKRLIGTLNYKLRRRHEVKWHYLENALEIIKQEKPDYVINTGDMTSVSEPAEFAEALQRLKPLIKNENFQFLNVPGNHDYYIENSIASASRFSTFDQLNKNLYPLADFPIKIETAELVFILVDESRPNWGINSSGKLKEADFLKIARWCEENQSKPVILVGHYPLKNSSGKFLSQSRALENCEGLVDLLEKGKISINLCGHIHTAFMRKEASGSMEICAGSLTIGGKLNKLEFNKENKSFSQSWIDLK